MFAQSCRHEAAEPPTEFQAENRQPSRIHLSAVIAAACYLASAVLAFLLAPSMRRDVLTGGPGIYVQVCALIGFIVLVALIQRHMGISVRANRTEMPEALCTTGPFRYSRNPIYLAFIGPLAALSYYSPIAAATAIVAYVLSTTRFVIRDEEHALQAKFGDAFESYRSRTPRWIFFKDRQANRT
jgi:protein-S-isoprenylcysteine O-methyltransferase Ste14